MDGYPVDDGKLATLAASRSGRVALAGFEYQRAFAVLRLAALMLRQSVPGCADIPRLLRYEWAEDIDELCMDGRIVLWQCKHGDDWHSPAPLAEVLLGFAPKWLWTPADQRHRLAFRLVTSDRTFAAHHDVPAPLPRDNGLRDAFLRHLAQPPGTRTDRARWQAEADATGHAALFEALCQAAACFNSLAFAARPEAELPQQHHGYLVAIRDFKFPAFVYVGETLTLEVAQREMLGQVIAFAVRATVAAAPKGPDRGQAQPREVASGRLLFAVTRA